VLRGHRPGSYRRSARISTLVHALVAACLAGLLVPCGTAVSAQAATGAAGWVWPLDPEPLVLAGFVTPAGPFGAGHRGVDLAAEVSQPVLAAGSGTVAFAGTVAGKPVVSIDHPGGLRTTYEPVLADVSTGDRVGAGTPVGRVAAAPGHCLPVTCLHWGLRTGPGLGIYRDPLSLVGRLPVRLLPVWWQAPGQVDPLDPVGPVGPVASIGLMESVGPVARSAAPDRGPLLAGAR